MVQGFIFHCFVDYIKESSDNICISFDDRTYRLVAVLFSLVLEIVSFMYSLMTFDQRYLFRKKNCVYCLDPRNRHETDESSLRDTHEIARPVNVRR